MAITALVAVAATIVATLVAIAAELALVAIAILVAILALEAAVLVVAPLGTRRAVGTAFAAFAEIFPMPAMAMTLAALLAVGGLRGLAFGGRSTRLGARLRTRLMMTLMAMALVARLAILVTAAGTPDLDELRLGGRGSGLDRCCGIGRCSSFDSGSFSGRGFKAGSLGGHSRLFGRRRDAGSIFGRDGRL
ncbi:hypothetical protein ABIF39_001637 [Bradyrhizobium diazoefficiens]